MKLYALIIGHTKSSLIKAKLLNKDNALEAKAPETTEREDTKW